MYKTDAWTWHRNPSPLQLSKEEKSLAPGDDDVLVENRAVGLNPVDWKLMEGLSPAWQAGQIPGVDGMGIIVPTGKNVAHPRKGSRVMYHTDLRHHGSFARHTLVKANAVIAVPDNISDATAASLPCPGLTAWQAIKKLPDIAGQTVLVNGAGGYVGNLITQLLINHAAHVYVTASERHHKKLSARGVIQAFDYKASGWKEDFRRMLGEKAVHAVFDTVNQQSAISLAGLLGYYGHLVCVQDRIETAPLPAFTTSISLHEIALASIHAYGTAQDLSQLRLAGETLLKQVGNGELQLAAPETVTFDDIPAALEKLKHNNDGTKYVALIAPQ